MFARLWRCLLLLLGCFAFALPVRADPSVTAIKLTDQGDGIRLQLDISKLVDFHFFVLADPYRVVIDFPSLKWQVAPGTSGHGQGPIQDYRFGQFRPDVSRLVLDASSPIEVVRATMTSQGAGRPARLLVDLQPTDRAKFMEAVRNSAPGALRADRKPASPPATAPPPRDRRKIIVLDPGHGGIDPGAIGISGIYEKDITLTLARELRRRLLATDRYRVVMTRDGDDFVSLAGRVRKARDAHGDLFISIHADTISDHSIRGGTVYTLSQTASDKEAEALANKENKADIIAGVDLGGESDVVTSILIDLAQRETMNHSASFAQVLVKELGHKVLMHNGHRFAGFRVLKAPDIPSVLIEIGYLSSRQDEEMLRSPAGRAKIADAVVAGVDRYFAGPGRLPEPIESSGR